MRKIHLLVRKSRMRLLMYLPLKIIKEIHVTVYQIKGYEEQGFLAEFEEHGVHYQLRGMMEQEEFKKL